MKHLLSMTAALLLGLTAWSQTRIPQLDRAAGKRVTFHYSYSLSREGADFSPVTEGRVVVEDNAYCIDGLEMEVISDGSVRWTLDRQAREAVVEAQEQDDIMVNPALLVRNYQRYGKRIHVRNGTDTTLDVVVDLDEDLRARFVLSDIYYTEPQGKSDFSLDEKSLSGDYVVTDLR